MTPSYHWVIKLVFMRYLKFFFLFEVSYLSTNKRPLHSCGNLALSVYGLMHRLAFLMLKSYSLYPYLENSFPYHINHISFYITQEKTDTFCIRLYCRPQSSKKTFRWPHHECQEQVREALKKENLSSIASHQWVNIFIQSSKTSLRTSRGNGEETLIKESSSCIEPHHWVKEKRTFRNLLMNVNRQEWEAFAKRMHIPLDFISESTFW